MTTIIQVRECSFEKCWGGGPENGGRGPCKFRIGFGGGPSKFRNGFGGGHVNSAYVEKSLSRYISKSLFIY